MYLASMYRITNLATRYCLRACQLNSFNCGLVCIAKCMLIVLGDQMVKLLILTNTYNKLFTYMYTEEYLIM